MKTKLMQFYDRYKRSINRKIRKKYKHTHPEGIAYHQVSQQAITTQALLGLLAKRSFFGSQCLRAKRRHATRSCLVKRTG